MSVSVCQVQVYHPYDGSAFLSLGAAAAGLATDSTRKRTTSFSSPPRKRLHRTDSFVDLSFAMQAPAPASTASTSAQVPYTRTLRFYKEQKERRRALLRREPPTLDPSPSTPSTNSTSTPTPVSATVTRRKSTPPPPPSPPPPRRSAPPSPLVGGHVVKCALTPPPPVRAPLPTRSAKPRSCPNPFASSSSLSNPFAAPKARQTSPPARSGKGKAPDLHRRAVTACMRASPAGAKILHMGARLAVGIMSATRELERMCGDDARAGGDQEMLDDGEEDEDEEEEDEDDDIDAEGVDDEDMIDSDEDLPLSFMTAKSTGRLIAASVSATAVEDVAMPDVQPTMSASWIVIEEERERAQREKEKEDWEMVEGA
ncbi:hypothetical protein B0H13DRAFT_2035231 [Mycena leptocephala]|nr:hypothetical protein B0H13DRAFT_2035231 [Mycena leptocephala]